MLTVNHLYATVGGQPILKGLNLTVNPGEIHVLMGPNGTGKSTFAKVLAGHPDCRVTEGEILFNGRSLLSLSPEERAHQGLFLSFQYPLEVPGVSNSLFLQEAVKAVRKARGQPPLSQEEFQALLKEKRKLVELSDEFDKRNVNEGFSGGEKKRNEILQMALLEPALAILDETDSGLDIDALKIVSSGVNALMSPQKALLIITHYSRLLDYIRPHFVHIMMAGTIVRSGGPELAQELEKKGYEFLSTSAEA